MASSAPSITVAVRVKPGSSRASVGGVYDGPDGKALVVAVRERAVDGRATQAVRQALARALDVKPAQVSVQRGVSSRNKLFRIEEPPPELAVRLERLKESASG